jgi:hypothetical protein
MVAIDVKMTTFHIANIQNNRPGSGYKKLQFLCIKYDAGTNVCFTLFAGEALLNTHMAIERMKTLFSFITNYYNVKEIPNRLNY